MPSAAIVFTQPGKPPQIRISDKACTRVPKENRLPLLLGKVRKATKTLVLSFDRPSILAPASMIRFLSEV